MGGWYRLFCLTSLHVPPRPQGLPGSRLLPSYAGRRAPRRAAWCSGRARLGRGPGRGHGGCVAEPTRMEDPHSAGSAGSGSCWWGQRAGTTRGGCELSCRAAACLEAGAAATHLCSRQCQSLCQCSSMARGPLLSNSPCLLLPSPMLPWEVPAAAGPPGPAAPHCAAEQG